MERLEIKTSSTHKVFVLIATLMCVLLPVYGFINQKDQAFLWLVLFGLLGAIALIRSLFGNQVRYIFDDEGIDVLRWTRTGSRKILWTDIKSVKVESWGESGKYILIQLKDKEKYLQGLSSFGRFGLTGGVSLNVQGTNMKIDDVLELIRQQIRMN
jgi:hypothetical protein